MIEAPDDAAELELYGLCARLAQLQANAVDDLRWPHPPIDGVRMDQTAKSLGTCYREIQRHGLRAIERLRVNRDNASRCIGKFESPESNARWRVMTIVYGQVVQQLKKIAET